MQGIDEQDAAYKRGLVLGLTLAEIVLLVLFVLLLVLAALFREQEEKIDRLAEQLATARTQEEDTRKALAQFQEKYNQLIEVVDDPQKFDELFRDLTLLKVQNERVQKLEAQLAELSEVNKRLKEDAQLTHALDKVGIKVNVPADRQRFVRAIESLKKGQPSVGDPIAAIEQAAKEFQEQATRIAGLEGQVKNIQKRFGGEGKGTEHPACWAEPDTGRIEYIFDVALAEDGLMIRDRKLAHRAAEQTALPIGGIDFYAKLDPASFLEQTRPLFNWSEGKNCRFFVRAYDLTAGHQKALYKNRMRIVEQHFYKLEIRDEPF